MRKLQNVICILFSFLNFAIATGQSVLNMIDPYTKEQTTYEQVVSFADGTAISKEKCDGVVYISKDNIFYKRVIPDGKINVKWYGAKGDGNINDVGTDDTESIQKAIDGLSKIYKTESLTGGFVYGGYTLYFPKGIYLISKTFVLTDGVQIIGESVTETVIHARQPKFIFTNIRGLASNGKDVLMSKNIAIKNLTLKQGGIELQNAVNSVVENIRIMNLFGNNTDTGILVKIPVNLLISNVQIFNSSGTGILYSDNAGAGPSTTATFDRLSISHCTTGMSVDGNSGGSHAILTSKIYNSIFEYNDVGLSFTGNIENFALRDSHFEQNKIAAINISGNITATFDNIWGDNVGNIIIDKNITATSKLYLSNVKIPVINKGSFKGIVSE